MSRDLKLAGEAERSNKLESPNRGEREAETGVDDVETRLAGPQLDC